MTSHHEGPGFGKLILTPNTANLSLTGPDWLY